MPLISTESPRYSHVVKHEYAPESGFTRAVVVVNQAAVDLKIGAVLGKVTASGKYIVCKADATDGSEVAAAIVAEDKSVPATTDTKVLVIVRGPAIVSKAGLILDATINTDAEKAAVYAAFEAKGILVNDAV